MHIQGVNTEIICSEVDTRKHFCQSQVFAVPIQHHFVWAFLHFALNEPQQMLLVHAGRMVYVSIHLAHIVKISVRHTLHEGIR